MAGIDKSGLFEAIRNGQLANVRDIVEAHPETVFSTDGEGQTPLHCAARAGQDSCVDYLVKLAAARKLDVLELQDKCGCTPLHLACLYNHPRAARRLLEAGARTSAQTKLLLLPLHFACAIGAIECVLVLLEFGAVFAPAALSDEDPKSAISLLPVANSAASFHFNPEDGVTALRRDLRQLLATDDDDDDDQLKDVTLTYAASSSATSSSSSLSSSSARFAHQAILCARSPVLRSAVLRARRSAGETVTLIEEGERFTVLSKDGSTVEIGFSAAFLAPTVRMFLEYAYTGLVSPFAPVQQAFFRSMEEKKKAMAQLHQRDQKADVVDVLSLSGVAEELYETGAELPSIDGPFLAAALNLALLARCLRVDELAQQCEEVIVLGLELCVHTALGTLFAFVRSMGAHNASAALRKTTAQFLVMHFAKLLSNPSALDLDSTELIRVLGWLKDCDVYEPKTIDEIGALAFQVAMRLSPKDWALCRKLLRALQNNKNAGPFLEPVDWQALNLPTYPEIIKQPMDYSTIQYKLETRQYRSHNDFANDVRLVSNNAMTFNIAGSEIYKAAADILKHFETNYNRQHWDTPIVPAVRPRRRSGGVPGAGDLPDDHLPVVSVAPPPSPYPDSKLLGATREFTVHDKRSLAMRLSQLPANLTRQAAEILRSAVAAVEDESSSERVQIDLCDIDDDHLRQLESYLDRVAPYTPPKLVPTARGHQGKRQRS